jgi:hypothetical protein
MSALTCSTRCAESGPVPFSAPPAESPTEKVWSDFSIRRPLVETVENGPVLLSFLMLRLTVSNDEDCYTFEGLASTPDVIHTAYYYHYKRTTFGLKEEARWS